LAAIHVVAAWQARKYSSSVDSAGAPTAVVTPAGDFSTAPGAASCVANEDDGAALLVGVAEAVDDDAGRDPDEHPASAAMVIMTAASNGRRRMQPIYATLADVLERTTCQECCRA
jgi:hypothetical protein